MKGSPPFAQLFPQLPNPSFSIKPEDQALYHSLCVSSGNFTNILWKQCLVEFKRIGVSESAALNYAKQCFSNFLNDPHHSLTGPLARNDQTTLETNRKALAETDLNEVFEAFVELHHRSKKFQINKEKAKSSEMEFALKDKKRNFQIKKIENLVENSWELQK